MPDRYLANLLGALGTAVCDRVEDALEEALGFTGAAPAALLSIGTRPGTTIEALSRVLGLSHSGTVRVVAKLDRDGLVMRDAGEDQRQVRLRLTDRGRETFGRLRDARERALAPLIERLRPDDRAALTDALERILAGVAGTREGARHTCRLCDHDACDGRPCPIGSSIDDGVAADP